MTAISPPSPLARLPDHRSRWVSTAGIAGMISGSRPHRRSRARRSAGGQDLPGGRLAEVAQQPVLREELMAAGGPGADLGESAQVAVAVPAEPVMDRAAVPVNGGQVRC